MIFVLHAMAIGSLALHGCPQSAALLTWTWTLPHERAYEVNRTTMFKSEKSRLGSFAMLLPVAVIARTSSPLDVA